MMEVQDNNSNKQEVCVTVVIEGIPTYQVNFQCQQNAIVGDLIEQLQMYNAHSFNQKSLFYDVQCSKKVSQVENVKNNRSFYLQLTTEEYQSIIKTIFSGRKQKDQRINELQCLSEDQGSRIGLVQKKNKDENVEGEINKKVQNINNTTYYQGSQPINNHAQRQQPPQVIPHQFYNPQVNKNNHQYPPPEAPKYFTTTSNSNNQIAPSPGSAPAPASGQCCNLI